jgi:hypothetical protein
MRDRGILYFQVAGGGWNPRPRSVSGRPDQSSGSYSSGGIPVVRALIEIPRAIPIGTKVATAAVLEKPEK